MGSRPIRVGEADGVDVVDGLLPLWFALVWQGQDATSASRFSKTEVSPSRLKALRAASAGSSPMFFRKMSIVTGDLASYRSVRRARGRMSLVALEVDLQQIDA